MIAHIRHNHTRYDKLLRETDWSTARATIEASCLEILVKWRGDEETGRDQMDEVLREVVVISDSEVSDSEETDDTDDEMEEGEVTDDGANTDVEMVDIQPPSVSSNPQTPLNEPRQKEVVSLLSSPHPATAQTGSDTGMACQHNLRTSRNLIREAERNERKGFKRYQAWNEAITRHQRNADAIPVTSSQDHSGQAKDHQPGLYDHSQPNPPSYPGDPRRHATGQEPRSQTPHQVSLVLFISAF